MQERDLYEYAVIRLMPRVEREEFLNVGVILLCKKRDFLEVLYEVNLERLRAFSPDSNVEEVKAHLEALARIAAADPTAGPIAQLDAAGRFRWLTAQRSTVLQASKVHPGLCTDPKGILERLFRQLVL
ncbi:MAG: DUF3037 domain-containing protein [Lewinellaceae bacterium]|nr:DUF3037 domain-containing protein [Saprospiraceae bacterium]MCB9339735.1 DUF3037 domain-containing protein [Lewinellaceae bacterium]